MNFKSIVKMSMIQMLVVVFLLAFAVLCTADVKKVSLSEDPWPPYTLGKTGQVPTGGIAVEFCNEIFGRLNIELDLKLFPWKRCLKQMEKGQRDGLMLLTKNSDREKFMVFTDSIMTDRDLVWYRADAAKPFAWTTFADWKGYKIGKSRGFNYGDGFNKAEKEFKFKTDVANTDLMNFKKMLKGRIDIFMCNETAANDIFKQNPDLAGKFKSADKPLKEVVFYMSFSKKSPVVAIVPKINKVIADMKSDGTINKILGR